MTAGRSRALYVPLNWLHFFTCGAVSGHAEHSALSVTNHHCQQGRGVKMSVARMCRPKVLRDNHTPARGIKVYGPQAAQERPRAGSNP